MKLDLDYLVRFMLGLLHMIYEISIILEIHCRPFFFTCNNVTNYAGIHTSLGINYSMVHIFGVKNTSLEHLHILVKVLYSVLSFLATWERFELF